MPPLTSRSCRRQTGSFSRVRRGNAGGTVLGTTATGLIAINTWYYIELQVVLSDTVGVVNLTIDGTSRLALTSQDTKNAGTKTVFDTMSLVGITGVTAKFDDLYRGHGRRRELPRITDAQRPLGCCSGS